jgi:hypothetical protein
MDEYMEYLLMSGQLAAMSEIEELADYINTHDEIEINMDGYTKEQLLGISEFLKMEGFKEMPSYGEDVKRYIRKR